ncbi:hypothetical protein ACFPES_16170 [Paenibacillus sp. GCM10023248]|uniref:hypothetical protein n=1 Tax=Bacillales TaxID=1385 RepID=UPI0023793A09|nr:MULTISPECIES: hypothetical protein [Bacillales]MDD9268576.1 hypothetical protein [Paenibacillus sp. MAHUQ-63]MDR6879474.1 hypothetical protein [Bacillus sp. 3255]
MINLMNGCRVKMIILLIVLINLGCSVTHSVSTSSTVSLSKQLKKEIPTIKNIKYTFTRPNLTINIEMRDVPTEESVNSILGNIKEFSTIENINEIAKSVKWKSEIYNINLIIHSPSEKKPPLKYSASYFKTFDASDTSEKNIDGYKTWTKYEEP